MLVYRGRRRAQMVKSGSACLQDAICTPGEPGCRICARCGRETRFVGGLPVGWTWALTPDGRVATVCAVRPALVQCHWTALAWNGGLYAARTVPWGEFVLGWLVGACAVEDISPCDLPTVYAVAGGMRLTFSACLYPALRLKICLPAEDLIPLPYRRPACTLISKGMADTCLSVPWAAGWCDSLRHLCVDLPLPSGCISTDGSTVMQTPLCHHRSWPFSGAVAMRNTGGATAPAAEPCATPGLLPYLPHSWFPWRATTTAAPGRFGRLRSFCASGGVALDACAPLFCLRFHHRWPAAHNGGTGMAGRSSALMRVFCSSAYRAAARRARGGSSSLRIFICVDRGVDLSMLERGGVSILRPAAVATASLCIIAEHRTCTRRHSLSSCLCAWLRIRVPPRWLSAMYCAGRQRRVWLCVLSAMTPRLPPCLRCIRWTHGLHMGSFRRAGYLRGCVSSR